MISALDELGSVVRCIELGAEDYLAKPFEPVLLRARIGACLEKKRLHDREAALRRELADWNRTLEERVREQVAQLERLSRLKRFFSPQLAELIVAGGAEDPLRTHRREITVAFLDLRGFTAFMETAEPEEVMGVLREYHSAMGELVLAHEGTLERFHRRRHDGVLQRSGARARPPARAVRMALAMRERVRGSPRAGAAAAGIWATASGSRRATRRSARSASRGGGTTAPSAPSPTSPRGSARRRGPTRSWSLSAWPRSSKTWPRSTPSGRSRSRASRGRYPRGGSAIPRGPRDRETPADVTRTFFVLGALSAGWP